ncbi:protein of unknown function [Azospirillum baldaniorum]|uniref:Uncharacterized protein n=1 Tax=Azospirillum baldaniorum TaxID=1064539 RepID=A0A9P1NLT5_9PROT|nr:protein of unknown function [Azospirillum baldaniorum]
MEAKPPNDFTRSNDKHDIARPSIADGRAMRSMVAL